MANLLITGAAGFIGFHFTRYWVESHPGDQVLALDALTYAGTETNLEDVRERITFVHGDICDSSLVEKVLREHRVGVVVNFAAESHNSLALLDPARFFRTNVLGTQTLLGGVPPGRRTALPPHLHLRGLRRPGPRRDRAFTEDSPYRPRTPYNARKAGADHAVRAYHETFGLPTTITNCANNYGPRQFPEKVIPLFTTRRCDDRPLPLYASTRPTDASGSTCSTTAGRSSIALRRGRAGETYHVGTGGRSEC